MPSFPCFQISSKHHLHCKTCGKIIYTHVYTNCNGNDQNNTFVNLLQHLLLCFSQPVESFSKIAAVVEMRCDDPKPAVFTVITPVVLSVNALTLRRARHHIST